MGIILPYSEKLNIAPLNRIFDNKSECYKLFWFQAILTCVAGGKTDIRYEELIDEMIADAWYMVSEYHLNLGPNDTLEKTVHRVREISGLKPAEKKVKVLEYLHACVDPQVVKNKKVLTNMVPYRLQAPFLENSSEIYAVKGGLSAQIDCLNLQPDLIYYYSKPMQLRTEIHVQPVWAEYIDTNLEILRGWVHFNMVEYLQRRNPAVPGIIDKLHAPEERKLASVQKYWKLLSERQPVHEIYQGHLVDPSAISIDHFVPWSYVAHDELWNLHPTTRSINSAKGNRLPDWDVYFPAFARLEYLSYCGNRDDEAVRGAFEKCAREHLNSDGVRSTLYVDGLDEAAFTQRLDHVVRPVYDAARNCGFAVWKV